jgi:hypothetical protein
MAGAHMFQAVQHPDLDTLSLVAIRDFLKKWARYLRLVAQNNKADGVNVTPITVVTSIDPELLENLIYMEEIDAESVEDCTDESVMEFLESTQERDASVTAEFVKAEVLAKVTFAMSEKDPALRVMKAVADYHSLHRNLRLDYINGKPKKAVEHLVSGIKPATLKDLIESKLEMDKSVLKKDFLEFVGFLKKMAIIHEEHCHVAEHKQTGDSGMKSNNKSRDAGSRSSGHKSGGSSHGGARNKASDRDRIKSGHGRSKDSTGTWKQSARETPPFLDTNKCAGEKHNLSDCPHTGKDEDMVLLSEYKKKRNADKKKANFKTLGNSRATTENRDGQTAYLTAENLGFKATVLADTGSDYPAIPRSAVEDARKRGFPLKVEVLLEPIMLNLTIRGEGDKQKCSATEMLMSAVTITTPSGPLCMHGVRQIIVEEDMDHPLVGRPVEDVFCRPDQCSLTNSYVDNNSSLISE